MSSRRKKVHFLTHWAGKPCLQRLPTAEWSNYHWDHRLLQVPRGQTSGRAGSTVVNSRMGSRPSWARAPFAAFISHVWCSAETRGLPACGTPHSDPVFSFWKGLPEGGPQPLVWQLTMPANADHSPLPTLPGERHLRLHPTIQVRASGQYRA